MLLPMHELTIGIDPGVSGGIAWGDSEGMELMKMPVEEDLADTIKKISKGCYRVNVYVEQVNGYIGVGQPGSRMFTFGDNFGQLKGIVRALDYNLILTRPAAWMKALELGTKGERTKTEWKNFLKDSAQELYPKHKIILATSDAALIFNAGLRGLLPRSV